MDGVLGVCGIFYPRSPCGERPDNKYYVWQFKGFLSTLSLRRATLALFLYRYFLRFSIHALLAESDRQNYECFEWIKLFLSTLSLRRATRDKVDSYMEFVFSIHALLAESDNQYNNTNQIWSNFSIHALLAESDR